MNQRGFTLLEVVFALLVLSAGLIGVLMAYQSAAKTGIEAEQSQRAVALLRGNFETITRDYDALGYAAVLASLTAQSYDETPVAAFPEFSIDVSVLEVNPDDDNATDDFLDASHGSGYARVTGVVSWNSGADQIKLETLLTDF